MRPRLVGLPIVALVTVILFTGVAAAVVKRVAVTSPVNAGENAMLTVNVAPRTACSARVASQPRPQALPRRVGGRITWRWKVDVSTQAGRWPIVVTCGKSGVLRTAVAVRLAGPELPLLDAAMIICNRAPNRLLKK